MSVPYAAANIEEKKDKMAAEEINYQSATRDVLLTLSKEIGEGWAGTSSSVGWCSFHETNTPNDR